MLRREEQQIVTEVLQHCNAFSVKQAKKVSLDSKPRVKF